LSEIFYVADGALEKKKEEEKRKKKSVVVQYGSKLICIGLSFMLIFLFVMCRKGVKSSLGRQDAGL
jgi:hypothetical protein